MSATGEQVTVPARAARPLGSIYAGNARAVLERGLTATRSSNWVVVASGFLEPVLYLLSLGLGLGSVIGAVETADGRAVPYAAYIAPALLAVSAMNGAIMDSTWNVFFKMRFSKLYEGMVATSLGPFDIAIGEIGLALLRGALYATGFLVIMQALGLNLAWTALLALPAVVLIAAGFASLGMAVTSFMRTFQQMDWVQFVLLPMFLFSATFYPISVYPPAIQLLVQLFPLYHGVEMIRGLTTGVLPEAMLLHIGYYLVMVAIGLVFTTRRLRALFLD